MRSVFVILLCCLFGLLTLQSCQGKIPLYPSDSTDTDFMTTNQGAPVWNNDNSLTVGPGGPILLEDYHLAEKLANFARERIPERVVHARGAVAKGTFKATADISQLTFADFLVRGRTTPVTVRFSTVIHERGSPESIRDPRGFAVKFYTRQGNQDLVGNNFPVFFIRDGIKFPDMIHALKPNPKSHIQEAWRILDFFSHVPESLHMFTFLLDDVGIPKNYRKMPGFGVHTFKLISKAGNQTLVKFHWVSKQGVENLMDDEAILVGGAQHSHATKDLYDSIEAGDYPKWDLFIQTMDPAKQDTYEFDPLDDTKTWPEDRFPLMKIGEMELNENPSNFHNENEQVAFDPAIIVPGIYYSEDKMLLTRVMNYHDAQRYRVGGNYLLLPINRPKTPYHNNHHDGQMNFMLRESEVNYLPSRFDTTKNAPTFAISNTLICGTRVKQPITKTNNFEQPGVRYRSFDAARQNRFVARFVDMATSDRVTDQIRSIWIDNWTKADAGLGAKVAAGIKEKMEMMKKPK